MNFTIVGLARIKSREFLQTLQTLPQNHVAIVFLAATACSHENGFILSERILRPFIRAHKKQLVDLMIEAQAAIIAMQHGDSTQERLKVGSRSKGNLWSKATRLKPTREVGP
jgi:hypothetical protein